MVDQHRPARRSRGLGRALLGIALEPLATLEARDAILFVDGKEIDPRSDRSRAAAR